MSVASLDRTLLAATLQSLGADGWLLYSFREQNPVAQRLLALGGLGTRRLFVWLPREGEPVAIAHRIELGPMGGFPGRVVPYARWEELHSALASVVQGRTVAMEISPDDAVPYLDRVPFGVVQMLERLGARVIGSGPLVTTFASRWSAAEEASHRRSAEAIAAIAQETLRWVVSQAGSGVTECAVQARVVEAIAAAGLTVPHGAPIVAFGANAADPHYEPLPGRDAALTPGDVVLLDLWAAAGASVPADQTWMAVAAPVVPPAVQRVWEAVRGARDAAIALFTTRVSAGAALAGWQLDRAARAVLERAGYGEAVLHRTGHSIDLELHGSGPCLDDFETHDTRELVPGVGFSIEPGVYLAGQFGIRSEVNGHWAADGARITPAVIQRDLIVSSH